MPHGVLFRGGRRAEISREGLLEDDLLDAVIGLAPNLFYGTASPPASSCCEQRAQSRRSGGARCCSSTPTPSSRQGVRRTISCPSTSRRSCRRTTPSPISRATPRVVTHDVLLANDVNLNIRRYADNAPPPEPHDVRAHLVGGIPEREVADKADLFAAHGFDPKHVFVERDSGLLRLLRRRHIEGRPAATRSSETWAL